MRDGLIIDCFCGGGGASVGEGQAIPRMDLKNNGHQKCKEISEKDVELLNSCSQEKVLKWFAGEWEKRENE